MSFARKPNELYSVSLRPRKKQTRHPNNTSSPSASVKKKLEMEKKTTDKERAKFMRNRIKVKQNQCPYLQELEMKQLKLMHWTELNITNWFLFEFAGPQDKDNEQSVINFIHHTHPLAFQFASSRLKDDDDFVTEATFLFGKTIMNFASERLKLLYKQ